MSFALDSSPTMRGSAPASSSSSSSARGSARERIGTLGPFLDAFERAAANFGDRMALRMNVEGAWREWTYAALRDDARRIASWLIENGVGRGATIALIAESRPEWSLAVLAGMMCGATLVPIDAKLTDSEIGVLLGHARPQLIFASRATHACARAIQAAVPSVSAVILIDGDANGDPALASSSFAPLSFAPLSFAPLSFASMRPRVRREPCRRDDAETALIVYTSGTTGSPKGVETTFGNLSFQVRAMDCAIGPSGRERFLSVLPLNHLYELICGLFAPITRGATICYSESLLPDDIVRAMCEEGVTSLVGVPLLFRAFKRGIERGVRQRGGERWLSGAMGVARLVPSFAMRRAMFAPILRSFAPHLRVLYSGGAALDPEVGTFFERIGIPIYQGYGLSETSPVIATNSPRANRLGSVGRPLAGVQVRIAKKDEADAVGEILTRGPHVMAGYLWRPDLTREVLDDGWLRTGDLGRIDDDGFLFVTGRSKDVIVLGGGKKVHPDEVDDVLARSPLFAEACVVGAPAQSTIARGFDEVCAVIVPDAALAERCPDPADLEATIGAEVLRVTRALAAFKRPTRVLVRREPLPKTATRKLKRPLVLDWILAERGDLKHTEPR